jgi:hypothetical protein
VLWIEARALCMFGCCPAPTTKLLPRLHFIIFRCVFSHEQARHDEVHL